MAYQSKFYGQEIDDAVQAVRDNETAWTGKQEKLTGTQGQVVGFDPAGNAVPQGTQDLVGPPGPAGPPGVDGAPGPAGTPGEDGFSPTVDVTEINGGHQVTITDAEGTHTFDVMDGQDGTGGGTAGVSSFNGRQGAVTPQKGDYNASMIEISPPTGMTATNVQESVYELFQFVSEGKALIASAVTDKGVETAADASFQTMHDNILAIPSGGGLPDDLCAITVSSDDPEGGEVSGGGTAQEGMTVVVTAEPLMAGYNFIGWYEGEQFLSNQPEYAFKVNESKSLTGSFMYGSRLPRGHTELQYVTTQNFTSIETDVNITPDVTRVVLDIEPVNKQAVPSYFLSGTNGANSNVIILYRNYNGDRLYWNAGLTNGGGYASQGNFSYKLDVNARIIIDIDPVEKLIKIGTNKFNFTPSFGTGKDEPLSIGWFPAYSASYAAQIMKIYSVKVYIGDMLKGDFVPCEDPIQNVGLYNLVTGVFCRNNSNVSQSEPIAGPVV